MSRTAHKLLSASGGDTGYEIDQSLMFNDGDSPYLTRSPGSAGNLKTWTLSFWIKRGALGALQVMYSSDNGSTGTTDYGIIYFDSSDRLGIYYGNITIALTNRVFRDVSAWYHIYIKMDTTQGTAADRWDLKINGVSETSFSESYNPNQNTDIAFNNNHAHYINRTSGGYYFEGYIAEFYNIDGTAKAVGDFAETDSETGQWIPKQYTGGSYGTTGFYLKFVSGAIGTDSSGSSNTWTANNLANADVMLDTPTNNFPTLNPLMGNGASGLTLSQGNLKAAQSSLTSDTAKAYSTMAFVSGKWYAEVSCSAANVYSGHGVVNTSQSSEGFDFSSSTNNVSAFTWGDRIFKNGAQTQTGLNSTAGSSNILGIAVDLDNGTVQFYSNGSTSGSAETLTRNTGDIFVFCDAADSSGYASNSAYEWNFGQNGTHSGTKTAGGNTDGNGIGNFVNAVPSGFLAPCSSNLPDPAVKLPGEHFNQLLYTGNETEDRAITGVGFAPDFVWLKSRNYNYWHQWHDRVRGVSGGALFPNNTNVQTATYSLASFDNDGFTVMKDANNDGQNDDGKTYVAWNWKANGTGSSNSDGSVTVTTSANATAGFSIIYHASEGYFGGTYGHGLGKKPAFIVSRDVDNVNNYYTWHQSYSNPTYNYMLLNTTGAIATSSANEYNPTSTLVMTDQGLDRKGVTYVWAEVDGFSKMSSYTGNGNANGPFVYCGFSPAWILVRNTIAENWELYDTVRDPWNPTDQGLRVDAADAEYDQSSNNRSFDILSNGFKVRGTNGGINGSGNTLLFVAFAEAPFKYANAR